MKKLPLPFVEVDETEKSPYLELFNRLYGIWYVRAGSFKGIKFFPSCFFTYNKK